MTFDGRLDVPAQYGDATISGTSVPVGTLATVTVTFPTAYATAPRAVYAQLSGFVSGAGSVLVRQVDMITATDFRITVVNLGTGAATWTDQPIRWMAIP